MSLGPPARRPAVRLSLRGLHALKPLQQALAEARAAAEREARLAREREAAAERERRAFELAVGPVIPLRAAPRACIARLRPEPAPRQREADEQRVMEEALSDDFDVENLLETDEGLSFLRPGVEAGVVRKLRRGHWAIQAQCDLHGLQREPARERLAGFLREARRAGLRCVRIIHGKGHGSPGREPVLKGKVRSWLVQKQEVLAFAQARAAEGGHGALIVLLQGASGGR